MAQKTKATMQGRQCSTENKEQNQHTRPVAGGQSLSAPVITGTAPLARFRYGDIAIPSSILRRGMSKSGRSPNRYYESFVIRSANFSAHLQTTQKLGCLGCTALAHTPFPQIWGELEQSAGCTAMQHTQEKSRSFDRYPDIGYHFFLVTAEKFFYPSEPGKQDIWFRIVFIKKFAVFDIVFIVIRGKDFEGDWIGIPCFVRSDNEGGEFCFKFFDSLFSGKAILGHYSGSPLADCLLCLRRRRLISPSKAVTTNCPVLSPGSFNCSIAPAMSCGTLAAIVCDLRLIALVAMLIYSKKGVQQYGRNKKSVQHLTCSTPLHKLVFNTLCFLNTNTAKPGSVTSTNRASNQTVIRGNDNG